MALLLRFKEKIHTECSLIGSPILDIKAIKLDGQPHSLKTHLQCKDLKSCDYIKKDKCKLYFIELSDFNAQLHHLIHNKSFTIEDAKKNYKN